MGGNHNSGRKRVDDPKYVNSVRVKVSTLVKIEELAERLGVTKSMIMQSAMDNGVESLYQIIQASERKM